MLPLLQLGPLTIRTPGLALLLGLWLGLDVASRAGVRRGLDEDRIFSFGFIVVLAGVIGARLAFVLANIGLYTRITPWTRVLGTIFSLSSGTEIGWAGLLIAAITAGVLIWRWELPPLALADAFAPGMAVMLIGVGLAAFFKGSLLGTPTTLPWGINLAGASRHPLQIYLMLAAAAAFGAAWWLEQRSDEPLAPGTTAQIVVLVLSIAVLLLDPLYADSPHMLYGLRSISLVALAVLLLDLLGFAWRAPTASAPH